MISTGIYGASGYAGQELVGLLGHHPRFEITFAVSESFQGQPVHGTALHYIEPGAAALEATELVFLCTPHGASAPLAERALAAGAKVVDLSADLRLKTTTTFENWYHQPHPSPALLPTPYGLPELNRHHLHQQDRIANPGCYPTSVLLPLLPLAYAGLLQAGQAIVVDAKSGVSGAGRTPKAGTHFVEVYSDLKPYNVGRLHRHIGEMEQELQVAMAEVGPVIFSPHLLPVDRGLLSTIYAPVTSDTERVRAVLETYYADEPFVHVLPPGHLVRLKDAAHTNHCLISVVPATANTVVLIAAIDNLRKGAASQAVQNANLMFDLPETTGLLETEQYAKTAKTDSVKNRR